MHPQGLVTASRFACALVVAAPTITDMTGSSGLLAPSTFPTKTSQMASGMHSAFSSPLRKGVLKLMTAFSANSTVLSILSSRQHSVDSRRPVVSSPRHTRSQCRASCRLHDRLSLPLRQANQDS
ncbi:hypothetical protein PoB_004469400 [Plakobranchus ocellatus]|uniref:Secreted protein n=1 Tax=Plakobranchus ocellatus TaxID=259542 RepID=A0AAV4BH61_9GAST|nr:hypothetical protein PoB_004469400 [Plakobranchus ocellatus]